MGIELKELKPDDKDYPFRFLACVPDYEKYTLFSINKLVVVPLYQVIDKIGIKPDVIVRDGISYCANCGAKMEVNEDDE